QEAFECSEDIFRLPKRPGSNSALKPLPDEILKAKDLKDFRNSLKSKLYASKRMELYRCKRLKAESKPTESKESFQNRLMDMIEEKRDEEAEKLKDRYEKMLQRLDDRYKRALQKLEKEQEDVNAAAASSIIDAGIAILGAFFGGKRSGASKMGSAIKGGSRALKERADVKRAKEALEQIEKRVENLKNELEEKIDLLDEKYSMQNFPVETFYIKPRKSDISIKNICIHWVWESR
ncbi:MAG: hypothetical protein L3J42_05490, partial [Hydrogenimonas sp.]|nr:hypothetical protein [Hydrogenimonas sp.]